MKLGSSGHQPVSIPRDNGATSRRRISLVDLERGVTRENGSLDSSTVRNSLIGVDGLLGSLPLK